MKAASLRVDELTAQVAAVDLDIREKEDDIKGLQVRLPGVNGGRGHIMGVQQVLPGCTTACTATSGLGFDLCYSSWTADVLCQARS